MSEDTERVSAQNAVESSRNTADKGSGGKAAGLPRADRTLLAMAVPEPLPSSDRVRETAPARATPVPRNPMFDDLVSAEDDICGLLAYALFEQNKRDWLASHTEVRGRDPTPEEFDAYIIGERIPRRLDTYRRLAQDMLSRAKGAGSTLPQPHGEGPVGPSAAHTPNAAGRETPVAQSGLKNAGGLRTMGLLLAGVVVIALVVRFAAGPLLGLP